MPDQERLLDLLVEWEERRQRGEAVSAEQLCPDDETLQAELRVRIQKRRKFQPVLDPPPTVSDEAIPGHPPVPAIDGYEIHNVIGAGGMGVVYRALQVKLQRTVALKMILGGPAASPQELRRFRTEAEAVARLQHANIVQVFQVGEQQGTPFLVLEYVPGGSLAQHLRASPLPPQRVAELMRDLARAVQHAHEQGVVHRDLKPANVLLTESGLPKVADFGLAKRLDAGDGYTQTGAILGSPSYMAPEQAEGRLEDVGPATDLYALGAILYEMLTGRPPFNGTTILETLEHVRTLEPVSPRSLQPGVPPDLEVICLKCLEKRPEDRYASARDLAEDLERFLAGEPIRARPPALWDTLARHLRRGNFHPHFRTFGNWMLAMAPVALATQLGVFWALHEHPDYPVLMTGTTLITVLLFQVFLVFGNQPVLRLVPANQRRHFNAVWVSETVGVVLFWLIVWAAVPGQSDLLLLVYPLWILQLGHAYFAFASEAGPFYVWGAFFYLLSVVVVFVLPWAPVIAGVLMFCNMTTMGLFLRFGIGTKPPDTAPRP